MCRRINWSLLLLACAACLVSGCSRDSADPVSDIAAEDSQQQRQAPAVVDRITPIGSGQDQRDILASTELRAEEWETEIDSQQCLEQLAAIGRLLVSFKPSSLPSKLRLIIADDYLAGPLRPKRLQRVFDGPTLRVDRYRREEVETDASATSFVGPEGFMESWADLLSPHPNASGLRIAFDIVGIKETSDVMQTRQNVNVTGTGQSNGFEYSATWTIDWTRPTPSSLPEIQSITVVDHEESVILTSRETLFRECTEAVLGANKLYHDQLTQDVSYWVSRIDNKLGMSLYGHQGIAVGDVNGDELEDLYLCQPGGIPNRLFMQNEDGTATEMAEQSGVDWNEPSHAALLIDLDNDGDQDLVVSTVPSTIVMANDGMGHFELKGMLPSPSCHFAVAADYDADGDLDLYLGGYASLGDASFVSPGPASLHDASNGGRNVLFRNDGDFQFTDVTRQVGLDANNSRFSLASCWEDFDNDGDQDLYVANDFGPNNLYRNDDGKFLDVADVTNTEDRNFGTSACWGDFDRDGWMDLYVSNLFSATGNRILTQPQFQSGTSDSMRSVLLRMARGNSLLKNETNQAFRDVSAEAGVTVGHRAWASQFVDVNNDGWEDLVVANGFVTDDDDPGDLVGFFWGRVVPLAPGVAATNEWSYFDDQLRQAYFALRFGRSWAARQRNCCFLNTGGDRFATISAISGLDYLDDSRGVASVDWDHDGDTDLWVSNRSGPRVRFLRNDASSTNHFVSLRLEGDGSTSSRDAIGARVELVTSDEASLKQIKTLRAGAGFASQSSKWVSFGLGSTERIDDVVVSWPGGERESFGAVPADSWFRLVQGSGNAIRWDPPKRTADLSPSENKKIAKAELSSRSLLAVPRPIPKLQYVDFLGKPQSVFAEEQPRAVLVNLWASWCAPCLRQIRSFSDEADRIRDANLKVIALNVDGLNDEGTSNPQQILKTLADVNFPFDSGAASEETLDRLRYAQLQLYQWNEDLVVPMSLLISADGRLAAIYRGPVDVDQLIADVKGLSATPVQRRQLASPFGGRWATDVPTLDLLEVAEQFRAAGYLPEAEAAYEELLREEKDRPSVHAMLGFVKHRQGQVENAIPHYRKALRDEDDVESRFNLAQALSSRGRVDEAAVSFRDALKVDPKHTKSLFHYGKLLVEQQRGDEAIEMFQRLSLADPDFVEAYLELAKIYHRKQWHQKAINQYERALERAPDQPAILTAMGVSLVEQGRVGEAAKLFQRALARDPDFEPAKKNLVRIGR